MNKAYLHKTIGSAFGARKVTNHDIQLKFPEWSAQQIQSKIGVNERYHVSGGQDAVSLAVNAAEDFFNKEIIPKSSIDYVVLVTSSPRYITPSSSVLIQNELKLSNSVGAIDINQGCSGFVYGLSVAKGLVLSGQARNILLLTSETYSKYIDSEDKSNLTIFGDAASCSLVTANPTNSRQIGEFMFGSDGSGYKEIIVDNNRFSMNGKAVFNFTAKRVVSDLGSFVNLDVYDGDFVFHQANAFMLDYLRKKLKIDKSQFVVEMENFGNTVSSSIPLALPKSENDNVVLAGFGVGLSWSFVKLFKP
jgi:3-oxoacyl-[acyl-carrier-protein] synthase III